MSRSASTSRISASTARTVLIIVLIIILGAMAGGFYLAYTRLDHVATAVSKAQSDAQNSDRRTQELITLKSELEKNQTTVQKAAQIVAESKNYQYQNQIIDDLNDYARRAGVTISSFNFETGTTGTSGSPTTTPSATSPAPQTTPGPNNQQPAASTLKTTKVSVQLGENVSYTSLLHLLHLIERNLTRMQVANLSLSRTENSDQIGSQTLNLEVYIR